MPFRRCTRILHLGVCLSCVSCAGIFSAIVFAADDQAAPPEPPPVSQYAPAESLLNQVESYVEDLGEEFEEPEKYSKIAQVRVAKDASVLVVLFTALGVHDQETDLKASAPRLVEIAEELATSASMYSEAKAAYDQLLTTLKQGATGGGPLSWEKRSQLDLLMKQVSTVNSRLKRNTLRESALARRKEEAAGQAALLAAIGQATLVDKHAVTDPSMLNQWYELSAEMRDAAGAVGQAIAKDDFAGIQDAVKRLQKNCDDCHEAFQIDE